MKKSERAAALRAIGSGEAKYVVGTHALLSGDVGFRRLGLLITDEQHRFGVSQRALAARKGERTGTAAESPDVLVMSATPSPRTLAA
jgi:ATP-dependent DNA helicase RecG